MRRSVWLMLICRESGVIEDDSISGYFDNFPEGKVRLNKQASPIDWEHSLTFSSRALQRAQYSNGAAHWLASLREHSVFACCFMLSGERRHNRKYVCSRIRSKTTGHLASMRFPESGTACMFSRGEHWSSVFPRGSLAGCFPKPSTAYMSSFAGHLLHVLWFLIGWKILYQDIVWQQLQHGRNTKYHCQFKK